MTIAARIEHMGKKKARLKIGTSIRPQKTGEVSLAPSPWDMGASGPANREGLVREGRPFVDPETGQESNPNGIHGMRRQTWVDRYVRNGTLTTRQANVARALYAASQGKLRQDPLSALRIDRTGEVNDPQAASVDARRDFHRMWAMVPEYAKAVVERVVLEDRPVWS